MGLRQTRSIRRNSRSSLLMRQLSMSPGHAAPGLPRAAGLTAFAFRPKIQMILN